MNKHKQRSTQHQNYSGSANCIRPLSRERDRVYSMSQLQSLKPNFGFLTQEIPQMFSPKDCQKDFVRTT
ncbi:hypothetical protein GIB67_017069 [Kingdonia uniflora]|uniref:Uncharacterized protein n=1 Tax=Kingdonia uniflora TaxID=39325 RepID=A0A7J7NCH1_9MAGN|nr:hypothetical protein GIB67_017069 [Kingdonia uniflora]